MLTGRLTRRPTNSWKRNLLDEDMRLYILPLHKSPACTQLPVNNPLQLLVKVREMVLKTISTQEKFPRTENFPEISLLKVENFQPQNFFRRKICVGQSHFTKCSFCGKFSWVEMHGPLYSTAWPKVFDFLLVD